MYPDSHLPKKVKGGMVTGWHFSDNRLSAEPDTGSPKSDCRAAVDPCAVAETSFGTVVKIQQVVYARLCTHTCIRVRAPLFTLLFHGCGAIIPK